MLVRMATLLLFALVMSTIVPPPSAQAANELPNVAYTGVYLMGGKQTEERFPVYMRNRERIMKVVRSEMERTNAGKKLPFNLLLSTDMEEIKTGIDNTLSLAFVVIRDDVTAETFRAARTTLHKTIINVGLTAILYDTRRIDGKDRNTVLFSFPLVAYSQRLDSKKPTDAEIDTLFVENARTAVHENLVKRLADVTLSEIRGEVTGTGVGGATVNVGSVNGVEKGQSARFLVGGKKAGSGTVVELSRSTAVIEVPPELKAEKGMKVRMTNIRAASDETFQVVESRVSSKKAAKLFPQEVMGPQLAQWFSSFLTDRGGKVVLPSRVGGEWDQRATGEAFKLIDRAGIEHEFELPAPKYPVVLDVTGVSSKVVNSNDVNDICLFKAWVKISVPEKKYEKEFDINSSKSLIKGVQSFEEKNEFFDLLYQLTAKIAREAEI